VMGCKESKVVEPEPIVEIVKSEDDEEYDSDLTDDDEGEDGSLVDNETKSRDSQLGQMTNMFRKKKRPNVSVTGLELTIFGFVGLFDGFVNKKGLVDGQGTWKREGGGEYFKGEFIKGKICGNGKFTFSDGSYYDGNWLDNKKHGYGKEKNMQGSSMAWDTEDREYMGIYEGEFIDGKRQGQGKQLFMNGDIYEGSWLKNRKHGKGKFIYKSGGSYEGDYQNDERNGNGKLIYPLDGGFYEGEFMDGIPNGKGIEKRRDDTIYHDGIWINGVPSRISDQRIDGKNSKVIDPIVQCAPHGRNMPDPPKPWSKPAP